MNVRNTTTVFFLTKTSHTRTHTLQNMRNRLRTRKRSERGEQAARGMVVAVRGEAALRERVRPNVQKVRHQTVHLFFCYAVCTWWPIGLPFRWRDVATVAAMEWVSAPGNWRERFVSPAEEPEAFVWCECNFDFHFASLLFSSASLTSTRTTLTLQQV